MNKVILMGRLTRDPETRYSNNGMAIARFDIAVDRRFKREGQPDADFFRCTAFNKTGEFVEKYLHKGTKVVLDGEIQNDNYTNKDGNKVYGTQIICNNIEFAESKSAAQNYSSAADAAPSGQAQPAPAPSEAPDSGFMNIPDGIEGDDLPFL